MAIIKITDDALYAKIKTLAKKERRSITKQIEVMLSEQLKTL